MVIAAVEIVVSPTNKLGITKISLNFLFHMYFMVWGTAVKALKSLQHAAQTCFKSYIILELLSAMVIFTTF